MVVGIQVMDEGYPTATHQDGKISITLGLSRERIDPLSGVMSSIVSIAIEVVEDKCNILQMLDPEMPGLTGRLRIETEAVLSQILQAIVSFPERQSTDRTLAAYRQEFTL